jgi:ribonuclease Z
MRNAFVACICAALLLLTIPTATQSPQELRVVLLGTGTPSPVMTRFGASILVDAGTEHFLFDAGRGALQRLRQIGINDVTRLFLTHLHSDHVVGIPDLYLTGWLFSNRQVPFSVRGPDGTSAMMNHLREAFAIDIGFRISDDKKPADGAKVDAKDITEGVAYEANGVKVSAFDVDHRPIKPALGYRIDFGGHSVVLSGDTRFSENLIAHARGADLLIHEVAAIEGQTQATSSVLEHHTTPEQAGEVFSRVHPKLAVYSHIVGGFSDEQLVKITRKTYQGPLVVGSDLMAFGVGDTIAVYEIK